MDRVELKNWAKEKIKGNIWKLLPAILVAGIISNLSYSKTVVDGSTVQTTTYSFGFLFFFIEVGLAYFMINFITDKEYKFNDIFAYSKDFGKLLCVGIVRVIFIALWTLLLIVPGIIKAFAYALVPMLCTEDKYRDLGVTEILKKSEEMMNGHKMDYFVLCLSFLGWIILTPFTLGILLIWLAPYMETATTKFLYDVKCEYEAANGEAKVETTNEVSSNVTNCPKCGAKLEADDKFCTACGEKVE